MTAHFAGQEWPGVSVFYKDEAGAVFHTHSTYGRGVEVMMGAYRMLDLAPKGRGEPDDTIYKMDWLRHHDRHEAAPVAKAASAGARRHRSRARRSQSSRCVPSIATAVCVAAVGGVPKIGMMWLPRGRSPREPQSVAGRVIEQNQEQDQATPVLKELRHSRTVRSD